ncbi:hypothetical protein FRC08_005813 [Ceratobasidium sp. 394]|nr:hypothetical protein FRC08_005813 [Ceratobasidium sp. 394]KAG9086317.1 hypothetical protein FS749_003723 [Ceratobasidium sp. UAMH 11750]
MHPTKTLSFFSNDLQRDVTLLFTFQSPESSGLYRDLFPVVWKHPKFQARGHSKATISYAPRLAFGFEQTDDDNQVTASEWVDIIGGDATSLVGTEDKKYFGPVTHNPNTKRVTCENQTDGLTNLNLGLVKGQDVNERFEAIFLWKDLQRGISASAEFIPILQARAVKDYVEGSEILNEKPENEPIWTQNLNELGEVTAWKLVENSENGTFSIQPEPVA